MILKLQKIINELIVILVNKLNLHHPKYGSILKSDSNLRQWADGFSLPQTLKRCDK